MGRHLSVIGSDDCIVSLIENDRNKILSYCSSFGVFTKGLHIQKLNKIRRTRAWNLKKNASFQFMLHDLILRNID